MKNYKIPMILSRELENCKIKDVDFIKAKIGFINRISTRVVARENVFINSACMSGKPNLQNI